MWVCLFRVWFIFISIQHNRFITDGTSPPNAGYFRGRREILCLICGTRSTYVTYAHWIVPAVLSIETRVDRKQTARGWVTRGWKWRQWCFQTFSHIIAGSCWIKQRALKRHRCFRLFILKSRLKFVRRPFARAEETGPPSPLLLLCPFGRVGKRGLTLSTFKAHGAWGNSQRRMDFEVNFMKRWKREWGWGRKEH